MSGKDEFRLLLDACRRQEDAAATDLVQRYLPHVRAAVRRKLGLSLRIRFDSLDFAQDVWLSFFRAALHRQDLSDEKALIGYLCEMARMKVAEEYRHQLAQKTGLERDIPLELGGEIVGRTPTPSAGAIADDEWERMTARLPERERAMLQMLRDGHTQVDTATAFGLSERTIKRLIQKVLERKALPNTPR